MTTNQKRHQAGTPGSMGGKYAPDRKNRADQVDMDGTFTDTDRYAPTLQDQLEREAATGIDHSDEDAVWSWTNMSDEFGDRYLEDLYEQSGGSIGTAGAIINGSGRDEWTRVGITTKKQFAAMRKYDVKPSDFTSEDRDVRMAAAAARGDLVFEGELLSGAYDIGNHSDLAALKGRVVAPPKEPIRVGGEVVTWNQMFTHQQLAYIDGYTAAIESVEQNNGEDFDPRASTIMDRPAKIRTGQGGAPVSLPESEDLAAVKAARTAGRSRAYDAVSFQAKATSGELDDGESVFINHGDAQGSLQVTDIRPVELPDGSMSKTEFTGRPLPGQYRYSGSAGSTVPASESQRWRFTVEQFDSWTAF